jgi:ParB family chromosome partitioning protein
MRLLDLDTEVQGHLVQGRLSVGHAKALLGLRTHEEQRVIAGQVLRRSLAVRATEEAVNDHLSKGGKPRKKRGSAAREVSPAVRHLENRLQQHLSTRVEIHHGEEKGKILIEYYGNDDLQRLLAQLGLPQQ